MEQFVIVENTRTLLLLIRGPWDCKPQSKLHYYLSMYLEIAEQSLTARLEPANDDHHHNYLIVPSN